MPKLQASPISPDPDLIVKTREKLGLTQTLAAAVIYKKLRSWQQWEAGDRQLDPALWELFLLKTGLKNLQLIV